MEKEPPGGLRARRLMVFPISFMFLFLFLSTVTMSIKAEPGNISLKKKDENVMRIKLKERKKKLIVIGIILVLVVSAIIGAVTLVFIYNPHNNEFIVTFNGKTKNGITSTTYTDENHTTVNEEFKSLFARDLLKIADDTFFVDGITIENDSWFWIINGGVVIVDGRGWYILESVKEKIEGLWYVENVTYNDEVIGFHTEISKSRW